MAWDDTKQADDLIASSEWNTMVSDQKSRVKESVKTISSDYTTSGETTILINSVNSKKEKDGFEDGDYTSNPAWTLNKNSASTIEVQNSVAFNGSYSFRVAGSTENNEGELRFNPNFSFSDGDTISCWMRTSGADAYFGVSSSSSGNFSGDVISAQLRGTQGDFRIYTTGGGSSAFGTASNDTWYRLELVFNPSTSDVTLNIYDSSNTQINSTTVNSGGKTDWPYVYLTGSMATTQESVYYDDPVYNITSAVSTVTLSSSDVSSGKIVRLKDATGLAGSNSVTIDTESSETIDGLSSISLNTDYGAKQLQSDGTNWHLISDG